MRRLTDFNPDPNVRQLPEDYPVNNAASDYTPLMYNAVGGSTIHWSAHFPRFHPSDFRVRSLDGVADDWPLDYDELEPYYDLNDRMIGVSGLAGDPSHPPRSPRQTPPLPIGPLGETMARGFDQLGWHWWPSDAAIISAPYGDGAPALQPLRPLRPRLPDGRALQRRRHLLAAGAPPRRGAADALPGARDHGGRQRPGAAARSTTTRAAQLQEQTAPVVIVACNGVGTPRLLLNSRSRHFPDGLANRSGLVGKNLMFHCFASVGGVFPEPLESMKGPIGACIFSHEFYETDPRRLRARLPVAGRPAVRPAEHGAGRPRRRGACRGARSTTAPSPSASGTWPSSA